MHLTTRQHFGKRVAHQLADTQLALRTARRCVAVMLFLPCHKIQTFKSPRLASLLKEGVDTRDKPGTAVEIGGVFLIRSREIRTHRLR